MIRPQPSHPPESPSLGGESVLSKDATIAYLIREAHRALSRDLQLRIARYGVNPGMWRFFRVLWEEDGINQRDLSARVGMSAPTTVLALDRMEKHGFVMRVRDDEDRRVARVYLTRKGKAMQAKLLPHAAEVNALACAGFSPDEVALLRKLLTAMRGNMAAGAKSGRKPRGQRSGAA